MPEREQVTHVINPQDPVKQAALIEQDRRDGELIREKIKLYQNESYQIEDHIIRGYN